MFDYVKCDRPLPDGWDRTNDYVGLQTKDFDCSMTTVWITEAGRLLIERFEYEEVPKAERPHPNDDGLLGLAGSLRRVNCRWDDVNYHGEFSFGGLEVVGKHPPDDRGYERLIYRDHDYTARFTDGVLVSLSVDCDEVAAPPQGGDR